MSATPVRGEGGRCQAAGAPTPGRSRALGAVRHRLSGPAQGGAGTSTERVGDGAEEGAGRDTGA